MVCSNSLTNSLLCLLGYGLQTGNNALSLVYSSMAGLELLFPRRYVVCLCVCVHRFFFFCCYCCYIFYNIFSLIFLLWICLCFCMDFSHFFLYNNFQTDFLLSLIPKQHSTLQFAYISTVSIPLSGKYFCFYLHLPVASVE